MLYDEGDDGMAEEFQRWMLLVDDAMDRVCGMRSRDIDDWGWWDAFDAGMTPGQAAREAAIAGGMF